MLNEKNSSVTGINTIIDMEVVWGCMLYIAESTAIQTWEQSVSKKKLRK